MECEVVGSNPLTLALTLILSLTLTLTGPVLGIDIPKSRCQQSKSGRSEGRGLWVVCTRNTMCGHETIRGARVVDTNPSGLCVHQIIRNHAIVRWTRAHQEEHGWWTGKPAYTIPPRTITLAAYTIPPPYYTHQEEHGWWTRKHQGGL